MYVYLCIYVLQMFIHVYILNNAMFLTLISSIPESIIQQTPTFLLVDFFTSFFYVHEWLVRFCELLLECDSLMMIP